jgi:hypothetical protein
MVELMERISSIAKNEGIDLNYFIKNNSGNKYKTFKGFIKGIQLGSVNLISIENVINRFNLSPNEFFELINKKLNPDTNPDSINKYG